MVMELSKDQKTLILFRHESLVMKMCKVECEYQTAEELTNAFGVDNNYVQDLRKRLFESKALDCQSGSGRTAVENEERMDLVVQ